MRSVHAVLVLVCLSLGAQVPVPASLTLRECIDRALAANRNRQVSLSSQRVAEAQLKQALSARWPEASLQITGLRRDQDPNFIFPSTTFSLGDMATPLAEAVAAAQLAKSGITPDSAGLDAYNTALTQATQQALSQFQGITIPKQNVKLLDRDLLTSSLSVHVPLYTGGKVGAAIREGRAGLAAAREEVHRTDLQIVQQVRDCYSSALFTHRLLALGQESLDRMQVMLDLTERLYQRGSERVRKTDYLRTRVLVASLRSLVLNLKANDEMARTALGNVMGLPWDASIQPADQELPDPEIPTGLAELVARAQALNPTAIQISQGLEAADAGVAKARAGHLPVVVLFGTADRYDNAYNQGLVSGQNRNTWTLGLRVQIPLFSGFRVEGEILEAKARREQLGQQQRLLQEGLGVQVKDAFLQLARASEQVQTIGQALESARENRQLHEEAYREELVETKDVVEAQLTELFISSQLQKARYDARIQQSRLDNLIGQSLGADR
nr:TolC family protein [uncultured Holophaga sp.]